MLQGIHANEFIKILSLTYCNLDKECSRAIFEMLIYSKSKIEKLYLGGNCLGNEGVIEVLKGVSVNKSLNELSLADN